MLRARVEDDSVLDATHNIYVFFFVRAGIDRWGVGWSIFIYKYYSVTVGVGVVSSCSRRSSSDFAYNESVMPLILTKKIRSWKWWRCGGDHRQ